MDALKILCGILCIFSTYVALCKAVISDKYERKSMSHILHGFTFKRIQISGLDVNKNARPKFQCSSTCSKYEACTSFYVDDGACVFGLQDDVTELANGDDVTPADWQFVKASFDGKISSYTAVIIMNSYRLTYVFVV